EFLLSYQRDCTGQLLVQGNRIDFRGECHHCSFCPRFYSFAFHTCSSCYAKPCRSFVCLSFGSKTRLFCRFSFFVPRCDRFARFCRRSNGNFTSRWPTWWLSSRLFGRSIYYRVDDGANDEPYTCKSLCGNGFR